MAVVRDYVKDYLEGNFRVKSFKVYNMTSDGIYCILDSQKDSCYSMGLNSLDTDIMSAYVIDSYLDYDTRHYDLYVEL